MMRTEQPTPRQIRIALAFTALMLFGKLVAQVVSPGFNGYDFRAIYAAGYLVRQGNGAKLYDVQVQTRTEAALFKQSDLLLIVHPPFEALLFAPLSSLPYRSAYLVWGTANILLWMFFVFLARPLAPVPRQTFQYLILCFAFSPLWWAMAHGQTTLLMVVLYWLTYRGLKRRQDFRAGAFLALGLLKFQLVLPFALICLLRQKWRMMVGFAATAALLGLASVVAVGPSGVLSYFQLLFYVVKHPADASYIGILPVDMVTLRGLISVLLAGKVAAKWTNALVAAVSLSLILFVAWRWRQRDQREGDASLGLAFGAALAVTLAVAFHLYIYDLGLVLPSLLLVIGSTQWSEKSRCRLAFNVAAVILYLPPVYMVLSNWNQRYLLFVPLAGFTISALGLLGKPASKRLSADDAATYGLLQVSSPAGENV